MYNGAVLKRVVDPEFSAVQNPKYFSIPGSRYGFDLFLTQH
jgi:hypothetical protein